MENQRTNGIQLLNGWESVGVIGRGSSGTVYRAKRVIGRNTEWAAVKHISMPANQDDLNMIRSELGTANEDTINSYLYESLQDMLGEYFQMKSLQGNTNIVACQDIQQIPKADGIGYDVYIWMELLESLSKRIIDGKMDRNETIRMGMDICQALSLLRSNGIVHRDIKPQNIFVNARGDYKLGDFGSARGIKGTSTIMTIKGTFSYMAPEIMQGRPANYTSDLYSLGLVMYRLMNRNRHPFIQEGDISSARGIEESNYRRLGGEALPIPVDADEELGRIILKACAFEPRNRWQTPEEMYNALAALGEETIKKTSPIDWSPVLPTPKKEATADSFEAASAPQKSTSAFSAPEKEEAVAEKAEQRIDPKSTEQEEEAQTESFAAERPATVETMPSANRNKVKPAKSKQESPRKKTRLLWLLLLGAVLVTGILYLFGVFRLPIQNCSFESTSSSIPVQSDDGNAIASAKNDDQTTHRANLVMRTGGETSISFGLGSVLASVITEQSVNSMTIEVESNNDALSDRKNLSDLYRDNCQLAIASYPILASFYYGDFSNVRMLAGLYAQSVQIVTTDPSIKSVTDLKGKRVCVGPIGSGSYSSAYDVFFAFGMDIEKDITLMYMTSLDGLDDMKNGLCDAVFVVSAVPNARVFELGDTAHLVSIDDEHLENLLTGWPYYSKMTIAKDVYGTDSDWQTVAVKTVLATNAAVSDNVAYNIVKTIFEYKNEIAAAHAKGVELDLTFATEGLDVPFHPGAAKYYKEQGIEVKTTPKVSDIKVGVILDYDENTTETFMHIEGIKTATKNLGLSEPEWRYRVEAIAAQQTAEDLVAQGCNVIIASGVGFERPLVQTARENTEVVFIIYDGEAANVCGLDNVVNVFPKIYESRYVSGVVAGLKLKELMDEGKITDPYVGYVETMGLPTMVSSYSAFFLGVRSVVPKVHMDVKYTYSWYDPNASSAAAQSLMDKGCVIICQGYPLDMGVPSAVQSAVESGQLHYCIGYGIDLLMAAPDAALTSAQVNMSAHYQAVLSDLLNGKPIAHDYALGYGYDGVMISALGESCAAGTAEKVEEVIAAINAGTLHVFDTSTFTVNGEKVNSNIVDFSTMNSNYTAVEYEGEKYETIFNGYFHESYFRSQPYFNLHVDGITEIY